MGKCKKKEDRQKRPPSTQPGLAPAPVQLLLCLLYCDAVSPRWGVALWPPLTAGFAHGVAVFLNQGAWSLDPH